MRSIAERLAEQRAVIEERDWLLHALTKHEGFDLTRIGTERTGNAPPVSYFRYERAGSTVEVRISIEKPQ